MPFQPGNSHHNTKLTEADVHAIRDLYEWRKAEIERINSIASAKALAEKFEVSESAVLQIVSFRRWSHI
ncbi:hypothetical protein [Pseudomonas luteola]|uniref:hypothetical protein n=1 Tax=Pseudomonas luteola TaxID=47886 RepID=UPI0012393940|nr:MULTISPECIES: hypothetical protein [Pseudomonas]MBA1249894.1 hypothetical protein [Pseudomonas zeshuii]QEU28806.1 hypothetical protein FOB45_13870 [Pseudomonas luteola]